MRTKQLLVPAIMMILSYIIVRAASVYIFPDSADIFPAIGVGIAVLFFCDIRIWPVILFAAVGGELLAGYAFVPALVHGAASSIEMVVGAYLLRRWKVDPIFRRERNVLILIAATFATSCVGAIVLALYPAQPSIPAPEQFAWMYVSSALTMLVIVPFLLRFIVKPRFKRTVQEWVFIGLVFSSVFLICIPIAYNIQTDLFGIPMRFLAYVPLLIIALRLRPRFVTLALCIVNAASVYSIARLDLAHDIHTLIPLELELLISGVTFLVIAAQEEERRTSDNLARSQMQSLKNALASIQGEAKARKDFIAVLAHELRNPLAPVVSILEILKLSQDKTVDEETVAMMSDRINTVNRILEDLLDTSQIEKGRPIYETHTMNIADSLSSAIISTEHYRFDRHQELAYTKSHTPIWIQADPVRVEQIFSNLLSNASKYSPSGTAIHLSLESVQGQAVVRIQDAGIGIAQEALVRIFRPFEQVHHLTKRIPGLGIGLSIAKSFVDIFGGTITAESKGLGQGTTFIVRFPLTSPPVAQVSDTPENKPRTFLKRQRAELPPLVLVVDDNEMAAATLGKLLEFMKFRVVYAYDGLSAIRTTMQLLPEAVVLDLNLPDQSGIDVLKTLRARGYQGRVIALSGYSKVDARTLYGDMDMFDAYIIKPASIEDVSQALYAAS